MFDVFKNRLEISGQLTTVTALRISAGRSTELIGSDLPVIKDALGRPLIPGSSFKGALRSRLESFLRAIDPKYAANPAIEEEWSITNEDLNGKKGIKVRVEEQLKKYPDSQRIGKRDGLLTQEIYEKTDLVSLVFGSPWLSSKFQVRDLTVVEGSWFGQYQERDGVSIDRDTETASDGKLYDYQVVPADTPFIFEAVVENAEPWELGLVMFGLHQFEKQQITLGGGRSRGLGVVELEIEKLMWINVEGKTQELIEYMKNLVNDNLTGYQLSEEQKQKWMDAFIEKIQSDSQSTSGIKQTST